MAIPSTYETGYLGSRWKREGVMMLHIGNARNEVELYQPQTLRDDQPFFMGTDRDIAIVERSTSLASNTALTNVLSGTPVASETPANSLLISNKTASGDIVLFGLIGGTNSTALLRFDVSAGLTEFNEGNVDIDFRIQGASNANMFVVDAGTDTLAVGDAVLGGVFLWINPTSTMVVTSARGTAVSFAGATITDSSATGTKADVSWLQIGQVTYTAGTAVTYTRAASVRIVGAPVAAGSVTIGTAYALYVVAGNSRFDGDLVMSGAAADSVGGAATAAAIEVSDGTTKYYALDTRVATAGVITHTWNISAYTIASAAGNVETGWSFAAHTLNYTGTTQVTTGANTVQVNARTIAGDTATLTVDQANTMQLVAPTEGTNVTLTAASAIRIVDAGGTPTNQYGIFIENLTVGVTADYAIWVAGANAVRLGSAGTGTGLLEIAGTTSGIVTMTVAAAAGTWTVTLPTSGGTSGYQLETNGSGVTSWTAAGSLREYKTGVLLITDRRDALDKLLGTQVYSFHYRDGMGTGDKRTSYVGVMADEAPWVMHHEGGILNPINAFGYTVLAVQALHQENEELRRRVSELEARVVALRGA